MRRSYWMLDETKKHIVLVHYRDTSEGKTNSASIVKSSAGQSCNFSQSVNRFALENQGTASLSYKNGSSKVVNKFEKLTAAGNVTTSREVEMSPFQVFEKQQATLQQGQVQMPQLGARSSQTIIPQPKFEIKEISPEWGFANESTKVIIIGSFHCDPSEFAGARFGDIGVPIQIMQDGVICITSTNGELCSEVKDFEYRDQYIRLQQEMVIALIENGALVDAFTHPTAEHPKGETPASIADAYGHKRLAGYLSEPTRFSVHVSEKESSVYVEAQVDVNNISMKCSARFEDVRSMNKELRRIIKIMLVVNYFEALFFRKRRQREAANHSEVDEYGLPGAGLRGCKKRKLDTFPQSKAKLVELSTNEEESALLVGTFLMDNENVDPFQWLLKASSPEYNEQWSLIEQHYRN